jgi:splicing factor 3A subunit 1
VDTIEFVESDEVLRLPPPISIMDLENMTLAQKKAATVTAQDSAADEEMEVCN